MKHPSDDFMDLQQYWDSFELAQEFRSIKQKRDMKAVFLAGATAVRDLMHKIGDQSYEQGLVVVNALERDIARWMKEMHGWGEESGDPAQPEPVIDLNSDRTEFFQREVLPLMRSVIDKSKQRGIGLVAAFELQRHPDATVKLASLLVPCSDGSINDVMARVMRELSNQAPECEPAAQPSHVLH